MSYLYALLGESILKPWSNAADDPFSDPKHFVNIGTPLGSVGIPFRGKYTPLCAVVHGYLSGLCEDFVDIREGPSCGPTNARRLIVHVLSGPAGVIGGPPCAKVARITMAATHQLYRSAQNR